jgi:hypothetical protein
MTPTPEQRAALERLRRMRDGEPEQLVYDEVDSDRLCNLREQDEETIIAAYLSEHPADDDEPVTVGWLESINWNYHKALHQWSSPCDDSHTDRMAARVVHWPGNAHGEWFIDGGRFASDLIPLPKMHTRRAVRSLLSALTNESE